MRHVLSLDDLTRPEILRVLDVAVELKQQLRDGQRPPLLAGHVMGLLFEKPSLRTRVSFESLIRQLGGGSLFLGKDVGWGEREPLCDFMPILTSYLDVLVIRAKSHQQVTESLPYSQCPIINGLTDLCHPCQAFADVLTMQELSGRRDNLTVAYLGDGNNVAYSLALICSKLGIDLRIGAPADYQLPDDLVARLNRESKTPHIIQTDDPRAACDQADFVYTDVWTSMGQEAESQRRLVDLAAFQVNAEIMRCARPAAKFLHCLPARRGEEVTTEVIDSPASAIIQQANNRLHAQKGLVMWLLTEAN